MSSSLRHHDLSLGRELERTASFKIIPFSSSSVSLRLFLLSDCVTVVLVRGPQIYLEVI